MKAYRESDDSSNLLMFRSLSHFSLVGVFINFFRFVWSFFTLENNLEFQFVLINFSRENPGTNLCFDIHRWYWVTKLPQNTNFNWRFNFKKSKIDFRSFSWRLIVSSWTWYWPSILKPDPHISGNSLKICFQIRSKQGTNLWIFYFKYFYRCRKIYSVAVKQYRL